MRGIDGAWRATGRSFEGGALTCIVGVAHGGNVWIGGDSAGVAGYAITLRADKKVFRNGDFIFGFTSSFRMGQLLEYSLNPPTRHPDTDVFKYMVTDFADAVRACLKAGGFASRSDEAESGGTFLVGYEGRLFRVDEDYQIGESIDRFDACGCGEEFALGSLHVTKKLKPRERVKVALEAACHFSAGVRPPVSIVELNGAAEARRAA